jgi:hypothetical protein
VLFPTIRYVPYQLHQPVDPSSFHSQSLGDGFGMDFILIYQMMYLPVAFENAKRPGLQSLHSAFAEQHQAKSPHSETFATSFKLKC